MTATELRAIGLALYGAEWQSPLARELGVNARTVRRWAAGESDLPDWLGAKLAGIAPGVRRGLEEAAAVLRAFERRAAKAG